MGLNKILQYDWPDFLSVLVFTIQNEVGAQRYFIFCSKIISISHYNGEKTLFLILIFYVVDPKVGESVDCEF